MRSALLLQMCSLCPVEAPCKSVQMREYLAGLPPEARTTVPGTLYKCWLVGLLETQASHPRLAA